MMEVPAIGNRFSRFISARGLIVLLGFTGIGIIHALMMNLPMAILKKEYWPNYRYNSHNTWRAEQEGLVYSSYFCGYLLSSQLPGLIRILDTDISPKWVMFFAVAINILCTFLTPVIAELHYFALVILRFNMGVAGGVTLPALKAMLSKWTLPADQSKMRELVHTTTILGFFVSIFISGIIASENFWDNVFYIMGGISMIWCLLWLVWAQDSPQQQPFISTEERDMIVTAIEEDELQSAHQNTPVPWREVITSKPFMATLIAYVCCDWGLYMMLFQLPVFLFKDSYFCIMEITMQISFSLLGSWLFNMGLSKALNWMQKCNVINMLTGRKIATTFATALPAIFLIVICFEEPSYNGVVIVLSVFTMMFSGGMVYGFHSNYYDIAPNFSDKLSEVTDNVLIIIRIMVPIFIAGLSSGGTAFIFGLSAALYLIAFIAFLLFGSVHEQPWNRVTEKNDSCKGSFLNA